jgi:hypothetical protein
MSVGVRMVGVSSNGVGVSVGDWDWGVAVIVGEAVAGGAIREGVLEGELSESGIPAAGSEFVIRIGGVLVRVED